MTKISSLYLGSRLLCSPLEAIYTLLIFILTKELDASLLQLTLLASSKPVSSLVAFYCSASMTGKQHQFKNYLIAANTIAALPALAFPFVDNCWYYVVSHFIFMIGQRAAFPTWTTTLKSHLSEAGLSTLQAKAISIQQAITIFVPLLIGYWIDLDRQIWKYLFFSLALMQITNSVVLQFLPAATSLPSSSLTPSLLSPLTQWRDSCKLLLARPDFFSYLQLFFWGGTGLVMMQSTLPLFFKNELHLSYTYLTLACSVCKGIGLITTTRVWAYWVNKISFYRLNFYINLFSLLFIAFVLLSNFDVNWIFIAYLMYGSMQAGCELSWNLSGPFFAKEKDCTLYSSLNLPLIGLRGLIFPFIGQWLLFYSGAHVVFLCAGALTLASLIYAHKLEANSASKWSSKPS